MMEGLVSALLVIGLWLIVRGVKSNCSMIMDASATSVPAQLQSGTQVGEG
jgi:hypothetical protein